MPTTAKRLLAGPFVIEFCQLLDKSLNKKTGSFGLGVCDTKNNVQPKSMNSLSDVDRRRGTKSGRKVSQDIQWKATNG